MERQPIEAEYPLSKGGQKLCYFLPQDRTEGKVGLFRDLERLHLHASTDPQVICISTEVCRDHGIVDQRYLASQRPASQRSGARPTKSRDPPCQPSCRYSSSRAIEMVTTRQYMPSKPHLAILGSATSSNVFTSLSRSFPLLSVLRYAPSLHTPRKKESGIYDERFTEGSFSGQGCRINGTGISAHSAWSTTYSSPETNTKIFQYCYCSCTDRRVLSSRGQQNASVA